MTLTASGQSSVHAGHWVQSEMSVLPPDAAIRLISSYPFQPSNLLQYGAVPTGCIPEFTLHVVTTS
jgi:hypothetical protein